MPAPCPRAPKGCPPARARLPTAENGGKSRFSVQPLELGSYNTGGGGNAGEPRRGGAAPGPPMKMGQVAIFSPAPRKTRAAAARHAQRTRSPARARARSAAARAPGPAPRKPCRGGAARHAGTCSPPGAGLGRAAWGGGGDVTRDVGWGWGMRLFRDL